MASVDLINLCKTFDNKNPVIKEVNLHIEDGAFLVIVGPSGCGKSTTLNIIAGLDTATSGDVLIDNSNVNLVEPKDRNIAMVFQSHALYPHLTVYENLAFYLKQKKIKKDIIDQKIRIVAAKLGIGDLLKRKPNQLSGGQQQRVAIGRAIIREPSVFLMDEPLSNLDANLRSTMRDELKNLHNELKTTFIYVTHDQAEAMSLATKLVVMNNGQIQQIGDPMDVFLKPANTFVAEFIGGSQTNFITCSLKKETNTTKIDFLGTSLCTLIESNGDNSGNEVVVAIRPDDFIVTESDDNNAICLIILSSSLLGTNTMLKCIYESSKESVSINILLPTEIASTYVDKIYVQPQLNRLVLFNPDTNNRLNLTENIKFVFH